MEMNLSHHRLKYESEINPFLEKMGTVEFFKYGNRVFKHLEDMKSGSKFDIVKHVEEKNWELFIKLACLYNHWNYGHPLSFNEEFTVITKNEL